MRIINIAVSILVTANAATAQQPRNLPTCEDLGIETCEGDDTSSCFGFGAGRITCAQQNGSGRVLRCTITRGDNTFECHNPRSDEGEEGEVLVTTERTANVATSQQPEPENLPEPLTCEDDGIETCKGDENSCFAVCGDTVPLPCSARCNGTPPVNGEPTNGVLSCTIRTNGEIKYQCFNPRDDEVKMDEVVVTTERTADDEEPEILTKSMIGLEDESCDDYGIETCQGDENSCFAECGEDDSMVKAPCQVSCSMHRNKRDVTRCTIKRGNEIKFQCFNGGDDEVVVHTESTANDEEPKTLTKSMLGLLRGISKN